MPMEQSLITHCSPTLASLKLASLFGYAYGTETELEKNVAYWNGQMEEKGIRLTVLKKEEHRALIYVYRPSQLEERLRCGGIKSFLEPYGYDGEDAVQAIGRLRERLWQCGGFPHEIGIFLGYPLEDVEGFIRNTGKNYCFCGLWKVYGDREAAEKLFGKYKKCTDVYLRLWSRGRSVRQLTVALS